MPPQFHDGMRLDNERICGAEGMEEAGLTHDGEGASAIQPRYCIRWA